MSQCRLRFLGIQIPIFIFFFAAPHQPRLDWQMWFAALGSYQYNFWFRVLCYRLLTNEPSVTALLQENPFPNKPPKFIKALLYTYHYSPADSDK